MKISIITVTYNCAKTLENTIKSVLSQDYPDIEYVVIDGGSNDGTLEILSHYKNRINVLISEPDKGIYDAMNKGVKMATGEVLGLLNADDFFASNHIISEVAGAFKREPGLDGVHGDLYYVDPVHTDKVIRYWKTKEYRPGAFSRGWHPAHPTLYLKKEVFLRSGGFNTSFTLSADFELMLRLYERYHIYTRHLNLVMVKMRTGGATSKNLQVVFQGIKQCCRAFKINHLYYPVFYPVMRIFPKLFQYFIRQAK